MQTAGDVSVRPLTPKLMDDLGVVLKGSWGSTCWCMFPRLTDKQMKELPAYQETLNAVVRPANTCMETSLQSMKTLETSGTLHTH